MTPAPGKLALLVSMVGLGLSAPVRACDDEALTLEPDIALAGSDEGVDSRLPADAAIAAAEAPALQAEPTTARYERPEPAGFAALDVVPAEDEPGGEPIAAAEPAVSAEATLPPSLYAEDVKPFMAISHGEKVLLDLAAVVTPDEAPTSGEAVLPPGPPADGVAAFVAASHGEKVLLSLALVHSPDWAEQGWASVRPDEITVDPGIAAEPAPQALAQAELVPPPPPAQMGNGWLAVTSSRLDGMRGGFVQDNLKISFGIERAVYLNGSLVTTTSLNVTGLGNPGAGGLPPALSGSSLALLQSGSGNRFVPTLQGANGAATVIQNSLDNQKLQTVTSINATVNSLQILRGIDLQSQVRGAVTDSLRR